MVRIDKEYSTLLLATFMTLAMDFMMTFTMTTMMTGFDAEFPENSLEDLRSASLLVSQRAHS
jgi:hypothetical protein